MVRIITDSAADFEPMELKCMDITCIPLRVMFGNDEYEENINLSKPEFYELLLGSQNVPKTSQASPQVLIDLFEDAHKNGDEAIYITLSSALSGTYQSALMVQNMLGYDECHVIDSLNATGGQRMIVEHAVKLRDEGKCADEILEELEAIRDRVVLYACINTLEYLYKGGRISQTVSPWPTSSPSSAWICRAVWRSPPRPWACARAWTICASAWKSRSPTAGSLCM